eukprot:702-Rhodomonas_salina.2
MPYHPTSFLCSIILRVSYARPSTDIALSERVPIALSIFYATSRTDTAAIALCIAYTMTGIDIAALYAMSGTDIGYAATRRQEAYRKAHVMHPLEPLAA